MKRRPPDMNEARNALTPEALHMMDAIARSGSFAAAARQLGRVPSALTYSVRHLEDALDVLLFDRGSRQAVLTTAGHELLEEGRRLLDETDAVANRVKRVATGWERQLSIAVDDIVSPLTVLELCEDFYASADPLGRSAADAAQPGARASAPPTRLRFRREVLAGTWEALVTGHADLAIGVAAGRELPDGILSKELGALEFVFAVAPSHPLAAASEPIDDARLLAHRAVAVADSAQRLAPLTVHLLPGQDVLTVSDMEAKIAVQVRGMACGFLPEPMIREHVASGRLVVKAVQRRRATVRLGYAWRATADGGAGGRRKPPLGLGLRWWLDRLESPATRRALLERHGQQPLPGG